MITVDIVRPERLSSGTGIATIVKKINDNKDVYLREGIEVNVFAVPEVDPTGAKPQNISLKKKLTDSLKKKIYATAKDIPAVAEWLIRRRIKESREFIDYYLSLNRNPDVVEVEGPMDAYYYLKTRKNKKPKLAVFFHSDGIPLEMYRIYYPCLEGTRFWKHMLECDKFVAENADTRVFITSIGLQNYLRSFPFAEKLGNATVVNGIADLPEDKRVAIIPEGKESQFKYRLCCTGTVVNRKGQNIVVEALRHTNPEALKNICVTFIGDGPDRNKLMGEVKKHNLERNARFLGKIDNSLVARYLQESNIYILMSLNEGLPMSILEAMRCSKPIISTNVSGIPETVENGFNGILLQPDAKELTELFNNMDRYDWATMGVNSREKYVRQFTIECNRENYCKMIKQTVGK